MSAGDILLFGLLTFLGAHYLLRRLSEAFERRKSESLRKWAAYPSTGWFLLDVHGRPVVYCPDDPSDTPELFAWQADHRGSVVVCLEGRALEDMYARFQARAAVERVKDLREEAVSREG